MKNLKQNFLNNSEISIINNLIDLDIKDRKGMIEAVKSIVISEETQMQDSLIRMNKRVVEALESMSEEDINRLVSSYPLSSDDIVKFAY